MGPTEAVVIDHPHHPESITMPLLIIATIAVVTLIAAAAASLAEPGGMSGTVIFDPAA